MYTGSIGANSNQEDFVRIFNLIDGNNVGVVATGASIVVFITDPDIPNNPIISGSVADGTVVISADGLTITWTFPALKMNVLCAGDYSVFARMTLNGVIRQLLSASLSVSEGGPT